MKPLCLIKHKGVWKPEINAKWDYRICLRCGKKQRRKVV